MIEGVKRYSTDVTVKSEGGLTIRLQVRINPQGKTCSVWRIPVNWLNPKLRVLEVIRNASGAVTSRGTETNQRAELEPQTGMEQPPPTGSRGACTWIWTAIRTVIVYSPFPRAIPPFCSLLWPRTSPTWKMFNRDVDGVPSHAGEWAGVIKPITVIKRIARYRVRYDEFTYFADQPWPHSLRLDWWSSPDLS